MIFYSKYKCPTFVVRHAGLPERHPITGDIIGPGLKRIAVEFGQVPGEVEYVDPMTNELTRGADIRGHYYDTVAGQEQNGWTDDEREMVERHLLRKCEETPEFISLHSEPKAAAPWPTYDQMTNYLKIAAFADEAGLLNEAVVYERQNKNREGVLAELEKRQADHQSEADLVAA